MKYHELHDLAKEHGMRLGLTVKTVSGARLRVSEPDMIVVYRKGDPDEVVFKTEFHAFQGPGMEDACDRVADWIRKAAV